MTPEELRALRLRHGLSQAELAELIPVTTACVSRWERGERPISPIFVKWHGHMLLAREQAVGMAAPGLYSKRSGRPYSVERQEKERAKLEAIERDQPILCTVRFCEPTDGRPMDPLTFRPYYVADTGDRYVFVPREFELGGPWNIQVIKPMASWSEFAWNVLREDLQRQLVAMGHLPQMAELYRVEAGARWSWHKVETSRPECLVMLAGMSE